MKPGQQRVSAQDLLAWNREQGRPLQAQDGRLEVHRNVSQEDMAAWRQKGPPRGGRREVLFQMSSTSMPRAYTEDGDTAVVDGGTEPYGRRDHREVIDAIKAKRMASLARLAKESPDFYRQYLDYLRTLLPGLGNMDDNTLINAAFQAVHEKAAKAVDRHLGRDKPLVSIEGG